MVITTKKQAFEILDTQPFGIPYDAIDFLYNHPADNEIESKVVSALELSHTEYYYAEDSGTPLYTQLWYMIVAEKYLNIEILDTLIILASIEDADSDLINEQISFLTGAICEKLGHVAVERVLNGLEYLMDSNIDSSYLFLFDCLVYADEKIHFDQMLRLFEHPNNNYSEPFAFRLGDNQYTSFLPALKTSINQISNLKESNTFLDITIDTLKEIVEELETGELIDPEEALPSNKARGDWKEYYGSLEAYFEEETYTFDDFDNFDDFDDSDDDFVPGNYLNDNIGTVKNTKKVGRNEPCPCGSGKKHKKCCL
jgi:hypothetical protein